MKPYKHWKHIQLEEMLLQQVSIYNLPDEFIELVELAVYDPRWNPIKDFDGCTGIQDKLHPYLPCFIHDYLWVTGQGGKASDRLFRWLLVKCATKKWKAAVMYAAVRIAWLFYYKHKHEFGGNVSFHHEAFKSCLKYI